uniref:Large ribosomal subunit protein uL22c n=2 Tax=Trichosanthes TaxID=3676 RepID=A0A6H0ESB2_9ROSI|nr:ribosomal protein L22 [Trichosanthes baviensis]YP_009753828.1 ribosomal protein L22 [Trichosanthes pilosa]UTQ76841.1 ribosomal protein L22 [Trichosanthes sp. PEBO4545]QIT04256.1 ribosomal protein L22 [Trichosanthes baviensis]QIT05692.1 ribosomal protein L22 [Trichosanthes pilosa]UTT74271.1 ribosomal protein L22 [Trichosanthes pilosa]
MIKKIKKNRYTEVYALGQHICMSPHKARRVIDQIRGRSYEETMMILELMPYRACYPILKLVYSAAANASHNMGFNERNLVISKAEVNQSTTVKKLKPRARGRSYPIKRPTCSITIVLKNTSFNEEEFQRYQYNIVDLNKPGGWITKETYTDMTCYDMYNNGGLWDKK